ncbi:MAG TPA: hypothetical protein P5550_02775 [Bacteroidales bacterium]|nr:hypothetical protein [Bacteroidales bacterium]
MHREGTFLLAARIVGIPVTALMLIFYGGYLIGHVAETGWKGAGLPHDLLHWYDDPTGFFLTYLVFYTIAWIRVLPGALGILGISMILAWINRDNAGFLIQAGLSSLIGGLYLLHYLFNKKKKV